MTAPSVRAGKDTGGFRLPSHGLRNSWPPGEGLARAEFPLAGTGSPAWHPGCLVCRTSAPTAQQMQDFLLLTAFVGLLDIRWRAHRAFRQWLANQPEDERQKIRAAMARHPF